MVRAKGIFAYECGCDERIRLVREIGSNKLKLEEREVGGRCKEGAISSRLGIRNGGTVVFFGEDFEETKLLNRSSYE